MEDGLWMKHIAKKDDRIAELETQLEEARTKLQRVQEYLEGPWHKECINRIKKMHAIITKKPKGGE